MKRINVTSETQAREAAVSESLNNPGRYIIVMPAFGGAFLAVEKRLGVFAPSESVVDWYVLNGKVKRFSDHQRIADQNATPTMA